MTPWVVKIGGRLCDDATTRQAFAQACAQLDAPLVIVHGGGAQITKLQSAFGMTPNFYEGRRITSAEEVAVVEMALSGAVNTSMVRALANAGRKALGLSGCDANLVRCDLVPNLGDVGLPKAVDASVIELLLQNGLTPVISPVSLGPNGQPLNVNADELACAVAAALKAERLLLLSDVSGVRVEGDEAVAQIADDEVEQLIASGVAHGGMVPKLRSAVMAVQNGVGQVRIAGFAGDGSLREVAGTCISSRQR